MHRRFNPPSSILNNSLTVSDFLKKKYSDFAPNKIQKRQTNSSVAKNVSYSLNLSDYGNVRFFMFWDFLGKEILFFVALPVKKVSGFVIFVSLFSLVFLKIFSSFRLS